jgi:hypothetical protein
MARVRHDAFVGFSRAIPASDLRAPIRHLGRDGVVDHRIFEKSFPSAERPGPRRQGPGFTTAAMAPKVNCRAEHGEAPTILSIGSTRVAVAWRWRCGRLTPAASRRSRSGLAR